MHIRRVTASTLFLIAISGSSSAAQGTPHSPVTAAPVAAPAAALLHPDRAELAAKAPDTYRVALSTSRGPMVIEVHRAWAPRGADRFYYLVRHGFYDGSAFFRVLKGYIAQVGLNAAPAVTTTWNAMAISDDPVAHANSRGTLTFASAGPNTRSTQLFLNLADNRSLDGMGFAPFGIVVSGMSLLDSLYSGYGEGAPEGKGPDQDRIMREGASYLARSFPKLDVIKSARIAPAAARSTTP